MQIFVTSILLAGFLVCGVSSKEKGITCYQVPKENRRSQLVGQGTATAASSAERGVGRSLEMEAMELIAPNWEVPAGWEVLPSTALKKGNFQVREGDAYAEITVIGFNGDVGGPLANINRWRQQVGLGPVEAPFVESLATVDIKAGEAKVVEICGCEGKSIYGALLAKSGQTWFFKMMGDTHIVEKEKDHFLVFLKSVDFKAEQNVN